MTTVLRNTRTYAESFLVSRAEWILGHPQSRLRRWRLADLTMANVKKFFGRCINIMGLVRKKNVADYWAKNRPSTSFPFLPRLYRSVFSLLFPVYFTPVILIHQCDCRMVLNRGTRYGQFLMRYVLPFDCWRAHNTIGLLGYRHLTVNHNLDFVDPITGACTNHVECFWSNDKMHNKCD